MSDEVLIRAEGVGKKFCRDLKTSLKYGVLDITADVLGKPRTHELRPKEFWAVQDVDFELRRGECLGLIGHNGAGKTTLLRMLNGLIKPDRGRIEVRGSVGALIALGAGFNPILTGRENIYINASILGLGKAEVDARLEEVIDFSEIGQFIDSPVRNYSSGMNVRLGFSVAALLLRPDILFLDEVLAVGDLAFKIKCLNLMRTIMDRTACVFVSHSMPLVSNFCTHVQLMDQGRFLGTPNDPMAEAIMKYVAMAPTLKTVMGKDQVKMAVVLDTSRNRNAAGIDEVQQGDELVVSVDCELHDESKIFFVMQTQGTTPLIYYMIMEKGTEKLFPPGRHRFKVALGKAEFNAGKFGLAVNVRRVADKKLLYKHEGIVDLLVSSDFVTWPHLVKKVQLAGMEVLSAEPAAHIGAGHGSH